MMKLSIVNPYSHKEITTVDCDDQQTIDKKLAKARASQREWAAMPLSHRVSVVEKFRDAMANQINELAVVLTSEVGKPLQQSIGEIKANLARIQFFLDHCSEVGQTRNVRSDGNTAESISFEPLGTILNISAWNYPFFVGTNVFVPALLMGNAVIYKPSEYATLTGNNILDLWASAGLPEGCFQNVIGDGEVGRMLLQHDFDGVFFTGSYETGAAIAKEVAPRMTKMQMELGGKDPVYVCEDVDIKAVAASVADGACYNAGQSCCGVERVYVAKEIYDEFLEALQAEVKNFKMGDPMKEETYIGPLTRQDQLEVLEEQVRDALTKGGRLLTGGQAAALGGNFFEPTILENLGHDMLVMTEESFGPIIPVMKVEGDEQAVNLMNDTRYGLTASVFTKDQKRAEAILRGVNSGSVYWNCCDRVSPFLPWSGRGHSGIGWTLSTMGIEAFLRPKAWHLRTP